VERENMSVGVLEANEIRVKNLKQAADAGAGDTGNATVENVVFTVGAEAANVITVSCQLKDGAGNDIAEKVALVLFLSDASTGTDITGTAANGGIAAGTDGSVLFSMTTGKSALFQCEADGDLDVAITHTGTNDYYLVAVLPSGRQVVSGIINFA